MKKLSIYENESEVKELATKKGWIEDADDDVDLLTMFEGDPDFLDIGNDNHIYFFDTEDNGEKILIHTGEMPWDKKYIDLIADWYDSKDEWDRIEGREAPEATETNPILYYRGGQGYWYSVWAKK